MAAYRGKLRVNDPKSPVHGAVFATAVGALTLIDPSKQHGLRQFAYCSAGAAITGWALWVSVRDDDEVSPELATAMTAAGAGSMFAISGFGDGVDRRIQNALHRSGAEHPRRIMALGAFVLTALTWVGDRTIERRQPDFGHVSAADLDAPADHASNPTK